MTEPTKEDMARDGEADMEVCKMTTAGPWKRDGKHVDTQWDSAIRICSADAWLAEDFSVTEEGCQMQAFCNADFITLAREALPAYIRRALWAEAEVERLRAMYAAAADRIAGQSDLLSRRAEK
jgi:hypothetical protein